jgi:hypothetical protein
VVLYHDLPCVDLEVTLHDKPADPWPEAGWLCLPFKIDQPRFRLGRLGSLVDPARDIVPGANRHLFAVNTGLMFTGADGAGLGICPIDHPLVSLDEPGCWRYSTDFVPKRPVAFVNLFNNQWTTNFRLWNEGTWTSRVRLWAIRRSKDGSALVTPAAEARLPLQAGIAEGAAGKLPPTRRGLELSRAGVFVTAFGPNPDGDGVVLRLWEQAGRSGKCQVSLPAGVPANSVQPVDLRGRPTDRPIPVRRGRFTVPLRAFAPASFLFGTAPTDVPPTGK